MPLNPEQLKALAMLAEGALSSEIAAKLKVSQRSIQRWQKLPEFVKGIAEIHTKATENTIETTAANISNRIQRLLPKALDTIEYYIENEEAKASDRLRACHLVGSWAGLTQQKQSTPSQPQTEQANTGLSEELVEQIRRQVLGIG
jgi:transposase